MELAKLRQSTQELYNDIDSCITDLINARTPGKKDEDGERRALFRMEGLMVATLQQLSCIIDALPTDTVHIPSVWREEDIKKSPSTYSWLLLTTTENMSTARNIMTPMETRLQKRYMMPWWAGPYIKLVGPRLFKQNDGR